MQTSTRRAFLAVAAAYLGLPAAAQGLFEKERIRALDLAKSAAVGSTGAADELKASANNGSRWAAMQYGWLAHTGKLPGGQNIQVAMRANNLACKVVGTKGELIALTGNYLAAYNMGLLYLSGISGAPTEEAGGLAVRWLRAASGEEGGSPFYPASVHLALIFDKGIPGVTPDPIEAAKNWRTGAVLMEPIALYRWGRALVEGSGVEQNYFEGFTKLSQAADRWEPDAMGLLAQLYAAGTRVHEQNPVQAAAWLLTATVRKPEYQALANAALRRLSEPDRKKARDISASWVRGRQRIPEAFNYSVPINQDPPRRT